MTAMFYDKVADQHRAIGRNQARRLFGDATPDRLRLALAICEERLSQLALPAITDHRAIDAAIERRWECEGIHRALTELIEEKSS